jgi:hypothetical protein
VCGGNVISNKPKIHKFFKCHSVINSKFKVMVKMCEQRRANYLALFEGAHIAHFILISAERSSKAKYIPFAPNPVARSPPEPRAPTANAHSDVCSGMQ